MKKEYFVAHGAAPKITITIQNISQSVWAWTAPLLASMLRWKCGKQLAKLFSIAKISKCSGFFLGGGGVFRSQVITRKIDSLTLCHSVRIPWANSPQLWLMEEHSLVSGLDQTPPYITLVKYFAGCDAVIHTHITGSTPDHQGWFTEFSSLACSRTFWLQG